MALLFRGDRKKFRD